MVLNWLCGVLILVPKSTRALHLAPSMEMRKGSSGGAPAEVTRMSPTTNPIIRFGGSLKPQTAGTVVARSARRMKVRCAIK